ncbi:matrixin family metalloprotease [Aquimarina sp. ERC-38]|uniref:matrixin family metalloprotease n=1 Tax=Aquimarina sp. ERC-38 TaxID=2949996 RepID=UPI002247D9E9|nr:matrixin family metalloprotease [Aquimarina sp. ERC-38]UZO82586.1 matrixin family metalloprotease [Aquimarina sp. ERC-38]
MKLFTILLIVLLFVACAPEDDYVPTQIEPVFTTNYDREIIVDIKFVISDDFNSSSLYDVNEKNLIENLNGSYFHRNNINLKLGEVGTFLNNELFDLKDDRGREKEVLKYVTVNSYNNERLTIYIIKRSNTIALGGVAISQRALITEEKLFESTTPHEIGHALGLEHTRTEHNIMSEYNPNLRTEFDPFQVAIMKRTIGRIVR